MVFINFYCHLIKVFNKIIKLFILVLKTILLLHRLALIAIETNTNKFVNNSDTSLEPILPKSKKIKIIEFKKLAKSKNHMFKF